MTLRGVWQFVASWVFVSLFGIVAAILSIVTLGTQRRHLTPFLLRFAGRNMCRIAGIRTEIEGAEHLNTDAMKIVTFNHGSILDAFLVTSVMPPGSVAALKREASYYPIIGQAVWLLGFLLIDRGNSEKARATMNRAGARMARERLTVFVAPEGTRATTPELLPFKKGAFHLALDSGAPIVPMLIVSAFDQHPPGRYVTKPGTIGIRFLPPRPTTGFTAETLGKEAESLREFYAVELAKFRADRERARR